jgi:hypothetical protein
MLLKLVIFVTRGKPLMTHGEFYFSPLLLRHSCGKIPSSLLILASTAQWPMYLWDSSVQPRKLWTGQVFATCDFVKYFLGLKMITLRKKLNQLIKILPFPIFPKPKMWNWKLKLFCFFHLCDPCVLFRAKDNNNLASIDNVY